MEWALLGVSVILLGTLSAVAWQIRRRHMQLWLPTYWRERRRFHAPRADEEIHLLLCFCDHYEPKAAGASIEQGMRRVAAWVERFPKQFGRFRDSDGKPPRYTFFFPMEEYEPQYLAALADLCRAGFGEVEVHLHHDNDTADGFRQKLRDFKDLLVQRHGLLSRDKTTGEIRYGFIHGNWSLCNSRRDGRLCGVNNELEILAQTGCYADFTFPSAPHETQPPIINRIYYAADRPGEPRSQDHALPTEAPKDHALLMVQGPLTLDWRRRKAGLFPSTENGCLQASQPPSIERLPNWLRAHVQVPGRPDWYVVKLHAHGAEEHDHEVLLGEPMVRFHEDLARWARENPNFHVHYVTARELCNLIKAAETGYRGPVDEARDWQLVSNLGRGASDALSQSKAPSSPEEPHPK